MSVASATSEQLSGRHVALVLAGVLVATLLGAMDQTIVSTALPTIGEVFGDPDSLTWVVSAYLLAGTAVIPLYGKASDVFGRRRIMMFALAVFMAGSIACALATSIEMLIAARLVQGIGGGGLVVLAFTIIGAVTTPADRAKYQIYISLVFTAAGAGGPVLGGLLTGYIDWSAIFWINVPLGLLATAVIAKALAGLPEERKQRSIDYLGGILIAAAASLTLLAIGQLDGPTPMTAIAAAAALASWLAFAWRIKAAREPFIAPLVLQNRTIRLSILASCFGWGVFLALIVVFPLYFHHLLGNSPAGTGLALFPMMIALNIGTFLTGQAIARLSNYKWIGVLGPGLAAIAVGVMAANAGAMSGPVLSALICLAAFGIGSVLPLTTIWVQVAAPTGHLGIATATLNFGRQLAGALAIGGFGTILLGGGVFAQYDKAAFAVIFGLAAASFLITALIISRTEQVTVSGRKH